MQALACTFRDSCRAWGCRSRRHVAVGVPHRPIVYQSLRAGVSAIGWTLDVGEGLSPVAPCRFILEAPNPAGVQHVDQLLCREVYKNRHWSPCAIEPRHPPVGAKLQQANIGANGEEVRCDSIGCTADALRDDKIGHRPAQLFGQITAKLEAGDRLDAPLSCQGSCEHVAQQG